MHRKILPLAEQNAPDLISTLFDPGKIADLLQCDVSSLIQELHESPDFSDQTRQSFFTYIGQQATGTSPAARLAAKYLAALKTYKPTGPEKVASGDALRLSRFMDRFRDTRDIYDVSHQLMLAMPLLRRQFSLYQNRFHPEGSIFVHTHQVLAATISLTAFLTAQIMDHPPQPWVDDFCRRTVQELPVSDRKKIRQDLEQLIDGIPKAKLLALAALFHDISKPDNMSKTIINNVYVIFKFGAGYHFDNKFSGHEAAGAELFLLIADRLSLTAQQKSFIYTLIKDHKDITDAVKYARKQVQNRESLLIDKLTGIINRYKQQYTLYTSGLLFFADNTIGKSVMNDSFIKEHALEIKELQKVFFMLMHV
jgi:hypothetical protein